VKIARFYTSKGQLEFELFEEDAPATVDHFCELVSQGFYNGHTFFNYIPETLIQSGCPNGDGTGHPGYFVKCELNGIRQHHDRGIISMANGGRNTNGSQFFICLNEANVKHLDGNHTCFGKVRNRGIENLDKLRRFDVIERIEILILDDFPDMNQIRI
jgi:peptidyl-prolyl cis-trans isomerase B (cyclophilin B)